MFGNFVRFTRVSMLQDGTNTMRIAGTPQCGTGSVWRSGRLRRCAGVVPCKSACITTKRVISGPRRITRLAAEGVDAKAGSWPQAVPICWEDVLCVGLSISRLMLGDKAYLHLCPCKSRRRHGSARTRFTLLCVKCVSISQYHH